MPHQASKRHLRYSVSMKIKGTWCTGAVVSRSSGLVSFHCCLEILEIMSKMTNPVNPKAVVWYRLGSEMSAHSKIFSGERRARRWLRCLRYSGVKIAAAEMAPGVEEGGGVNSCDGDEGTSGSVDAGDIAT